MARYSKCTYPLCENCPYDDCHVSYPSQYLGNAKKVGNACVYHGKKYPSEKGACRELGIPYPKIRSRKRIHPELTFEELVDYVPKDPKNSNSKPVEVNNEHYENGRVFCNAYGINYRTFSTYIYQHPTVSRNDVAMRFLRIKGVVV